MSANTAANPDFGAPITGEAVHIPHQGPAPAVEDLPGRAAGDAFIARIEASDEFQQYEDARDRMLRIEDGHQTGNLAPETVESRRRADEQEAVRRGREKIHNDAYLKHAREMVQLAHDNGGTLPSERDHRRLSGWDTVEVASRRYARGELGEYDEAVQRQVDFAKAKKELDWDEVVRVMDEAYDRAQGLEASREKGNNYSSSLQDVSDMKRIWGEFEGYSNNLTPKMQERYLEHREALEQAAAQSSEQPEPIEPEPAVEPEAPPAPSTTDDDDPQSPPSPPPPAIGRARVDDSTPSRDTADNGPWNRQDTSGESEGDSGHHSAIDEGGMDGDSLPSGDEESDEDAIAPPPSSRIFWEGWGDEAPSVVETHTHSHAPRKGWRSKRRDEGDGPAVVSDADDLPPILPPNRGAPAASDDEPHIPGIRRPRRWAWQRRNDDIADEEIPDYERPEGEGRFSPATMKHWLGTRRRQFKQMRKQMRGYGTQPKGGDSLSDPDAAAYYQLDRYNLRAPAMREQELLSLPKSEADATDILARKMITKLHERREGESQSDFDKRLDDIYFRDRRSWRRKFDSTKRKPIPDSFNLTKLADKVKSEIDEDNEIGGGDHERGVVYTRGALVRWARREHDLNKVQADAVVNALLQRGFTAGGGQGRKQKLIYNATPELEDAEV